METFVAEYAKQLLKSVQEHPNDYFYGVAAVPGVVEKMAKAFATRTYNKDGIAIKATCKVLGIKYTYAAINEYLNCTKEVVS